ncbi:MAG: hypothetical protein ACOCRB_02755 [Halanaerobiaceae bacterium]
MVKAGAQIYTTGEEMIDNLKVRGISVVNDENEKSLSIGIDLYHESDQNIFLSIARF